MKNCVIQCPEDILTEDKLLMFDTGAQMFSPAMASVAQGIELQSMHQSLQA